MNKTPSLLTRFRSSFARARTGALSYLASVTAIPVGRNDDGLTFRPHDNSYIDKPWPELFAEFQDAREAWRKNPLARRLVGLITSYVVGNGITLSSEHRNLQKFIADFWQHNQMDRRIEEWSDELTRSGELFPVLFTNPVNGMSSIRTVPACLIEWVEVDPNDYEIELRYKETGFVGASGEKWWTGPGSPDAHLSAIPLMLHYAVNRPVGATRGESDLAPILPWLRRYSRWLEDRVRLNAAVRAFLWIVHAPARMRSELMERYRTPPEAGSIIIADRDSESWEAVTPQLHATDAEKDGRAIRWMIVAGGPGTGLLDLGEGEDSNQATGTVMQEQRRRFLRRRQAYLVWLLTDLILHAYHRHKSISLTSDRAITAADITARAPDISPEDNNELAQAAAMLTGSLTSLKAIVGDSQPYRRMALRMFTKFAGETISEADFNEIIASGKTMEDLASESMPTTPGARQPGRPQPRPDEEGEDEGEAQQSDGDLLFGKFTFNENGHSPHE